MSTCQVQVSLPKIRLIAGKNWWHVCLYFHLAMPLLISLTAGRLSWCHEPSEDGRQVCRAHVQPTWEARMISECLHMKSWYAFFGNPRERKIGHYYIYIWNLSLSRWVFLQASVSLVGEQCLFTRGCLRVSEASGPWVLQKPRRCPSRRCSRAVATKAQGDDLTEDVPEEKLDNSTLRYCSIIGNSPTILTLFN